jgi:hypothetical protein
MFPGNKWNIPEKGQAKVKPGQTATTRIFIVVTFLLAVSSPTIAQSPDPVPTVPRASKRENRFNTN